MNDLIWELKFKISMLTLSIFNNIIRIIPYKTFVRNSIKWLEVYVLYHVLIKYSPIVNILSKHWTLIIIKYNTEIYGR